MLIISVLNSAFRLLVSIFLSSFSGVVLGTFFVFSFQLPPCVCVYVTGRAALSASLGGALCGRYPIGCNGAACWSPDLDTQVHPSYWLSATLLL